MKILVTGSNGMLGTAIQEVFSEHELYATTKDNFDVRQVRYTYWRGDLIIHLAAITDHTDSEVNWQNTYLTNTIGTHNMVEFARKLDIPIVYISSCTEYNGSKEMHCEEDTLNPCNHYSISKYYGDLAVMSYPKHWIIRSGWMFGGGPKKDKKFLNAIVYKMIKFGVKEFPSITDSFGNPTYTYDLAKTIKNMIEGNAPYGTYNVGGIGEASRYDMAVEFIRLLGVDVKVLPLTCKSYHKLYPKKVEYWKRAVLDCTKIQNSGFSAMRPWKETLKEYAQQYKEVPVGC